jgi:hypothetical protein
MQCSAQESDVPFTVRTVFVTVDEDAPQNNTLQEFCGPEVELIGGTSMEVARVHGVGLNSSDDDSDEDELPALLPDSENEAPRTKEEEQNLVVAR